MLGLILQCFFSPRLYKVYWEGPKERMYKPRSLEKWGDKVIIFAKASVYFGIYTSPFIFTYMYMKDFFKFEMMRGFFVYLGYFGCITATAFLIRSIGRANNPTYVKFLKTLNSEEINLDAIRKYDFEFHAWPCTHAIPPVKRYLQYPFQNCANVDLPAYKRIPLQILAFIAVHVFALRAIYPGTLMLMNKILWPTLFTGRTHLVEDFNGIRTKLRTADVNSIDTMFVDKRLVSVNGKTLVICCEGNAGFYEIGIMTTAIKAGYSTLGWNHPGFGESTGKPYKVSEQNAIEVVVDFAINKLNFKLKDIVLFGWSIGGYCATWAAVRYPEVKALVLDATFDDLLPLAQHQMPASWSSLVNEVVRSYFDLNIVELINQYNGPVKIIRRTEDEIICLRPGHLSSNRGNDLLIGLIKKRHPELSDEELKVIDKFVRFPEPQRTVHERYDVDNSYNKALKLITKYLHDYKGSHCAPLPKEHFNAVMEQLRKNE